MMMMITMIGLTNQIGSIEAAILYSFTFIFLLFLCWETSEERFALLFLYFYFSCDVMMELCVCLLCPSVCTALTQPVISMRRGMLRCQDRADDQRKAIKQSHPETKSLGFAGCGSVCVFRYLNLFQCLQNDISAVTSG